MDNGVTASAFDSAALVAALRRVVLDLEDDLRARVDNPDRDLREPGVFETWDAEYRAALTAQRTAASWQQWRNERVTQAAVAWVLLTVFARYCEDNSLVSPVWIAGPTADARRHALDGRNAYFTEHPDHTDRDWLRQISSHFERFTATRGLVDDYSPMHLVSPSGDVARAILEFWWQQDDAGAPRWSFVGVDTRFLGDTYQDLSDFAKKTYALLQTPDFVEEFILDQTMEPALAERPLEGFSLIDPTCGSGHFLLGAFDRLFDRWQKHAPALTSRQLAQKALDSVFGVDINPFAVAIARFRLLIAAVRAAGETSIEQNAGYETHLAAGDSLIWGAPHHLLHLDNLDESAPEYVSAIENYSALEKIFARTYSAVVGNPPYVSVKDSASRALYRSLYSSAHGKYVLSVPFMELFFELGDPPSTGLPGWVGQITSNSFMKREFGGKLVEEYLVTKDLRLIVDSSGAYIPGHGTPTVIMIGKSARPTGDSVRAVLGVRGEPGRPDDPAKALVWSSIRDNHLRTGYEDQWISVSDLPRSVLSAHPWSLSGGGASGLLSDIESVHGIKLQASSNSIGITCFTLEDDFFVRSVGAFWRTGADNSYLRQMVLGDELRDWQQSEHDRVAFPYDAEFTPLSRLGDVAGFERMFWSFRTQLAANKMFGNRTKVEAGLKWFEFGRLTASKLKTPLSITFAFVATHNHFVLDRGGKVFKQSAPVIKLPAGATEEDHLRLLGVLNSSVACFWLKQNSHAKGLGGVNQESRTEMWEGFYEFTGTTLKDFPLPASLPVARARTLDTLAQELTQRTPQAVAQRGVPTAAALADAQREFDRIRGLMIAHQEELDWENYRLYGLIQTDLTYTGELPALALGERTFEIALARAVAEGAETAWFTRHGSTPHTQIPAHLPAEYRALMAARLDLIASDRNIRLLEKPEHKRRWAVEPWDKRVTAALRDWLLDRVEARGLWFDADQRPTPKSVAQLADILDRDSDFRSVLQLWSGRPNATTTASLALLLADEAVPYLAALRYKPSGLDKRAAWEHTWALQRRKDAGETLAEPIAVPPKYKPVDFRKPAYWSHRGKLDVPKERFISYPGAGRDTDTTELLGWAGWDHAEQALALAALTTDRISDGWTTDTLVPMVAGLHELAPWVRQWHGEIDPEFGESVADTVDHEISRHLGALDITVDTLTAWRPPAATRGRARKGTT